MLPVIGYVISGLILLVQFYIDDSDFAVEQRAKQKTVVHKVVFCVVFLAVSPAWSTSVLLWDIASHQFGFKGMR